MDIIGRLNGKLNDESVRMFCGGLVDELIERNLDAVFLTGNALRMHIS